MASRKRPEGHWGSSAAWTGTANAQSTKLLWLCPSKPTVDQITQRVDLPVCTREAANAAHNTLGTRCTLALDQDKDHSCTTHSSVLSDFRAAMPRVNESLLAFSVLEPVFGTLRDWWWTMVGEFDLSLLILKMFSVSWKPEVQVDHFQLYVLEEFQGGWLP
ncbi:hypothetical protein E2C01_011921 [Portunus trituberculatus]|uniref:Uncharacterized protein n=1 Tax=Portunus trituberculatus TaxID=210409 RepID=A0A5B7DCK8_PORTR|nr:hypothetical protein [Portunus trituberculatus]